MTKNHLTISFLLMIFSLMVMGTAFAADKSGEAIYKELADTTKGKGDLSLFGTLNSMSRELDWSNANETEFIGNLRLLQHANMRGSVDKTSLYLVRDIANQLYILSIPEGMNIEQSSNSIYGGLSKSRESKMRYQVKTQKGELRGQSYQFAQFIDKPEPLLFDRIFKISIIVMLFSVMAGMGMTLTPKDFAIIATKPRGIIVGTIIQFGIMPLVAFGIGHLMGYAEAYPFIFVGMILITATPGGATSNLMTYFAKGDLALSISMTASATILSLFLIPVTLVFYCSNIPDVQMPVKTLVLTIIVLVLLPLLIGMFIRKKWETLALRATPFFSVLGMVSVIFIMVGGVMSNLEVFSNVARELGFTGFFVIFSLTMLGMVLGGVIPKLVRVNNFQTKAISMEIGIRNVALGMTIALLIQDSMGDFNSYMFAVSGLFALFMYGSGIVSIFLFKFILPVSEKMEDQKLA